MFAVQSHGIELVYMYKFKCKPSQNVIVTGKPHCISASADGSSLNVQLTPPSMVQRGMLCMQAASRAVVEKWWRLRR